MKSKKEINYLLIAFLFLTCYITSNFIATRQVLLIGLPVSASVFIYPMTYLIAIIFKEKYGNEKTKMLINLSIGALAFSALLVAIASLYPIDSYDGLNALFNTNLNICVASIIAFFISQNLNLIIYDLEKRSKAIKFLVSAIIAVTIDGILFVAFTNLIDVTVNEMINLVKGHYVLNGFVIIIYALLFWAISVLQNAWNKYRKDNPKEEKEKKKLKRSKKVQK